MPKDWSTPVNCAHLLADYVRTMDIHIKHTWKTLMPE